MSTANHEQLGTVIATNHLSTGANRPGIAQSAIWKVGACLLLATALADRSQAAFSSIDSNFNGTSISDTSWIWFNSHITSVSGASGPVTIFVQNQDISFTSPQTHLSYNLSVPNATIVINPGVGSPTISYAGGWQTAVPNASGNPFMSGFSFNVPTGEDPKAANPVTWSGNFYASQPGVKLSWQWAAAVYSSFSSDYNSLGVTPVDGYNGYSQSGTPANYTDFVIGGARGGGGSNFTGSNSGTATVVTDYMPVPEPTTFVAGALLLGPFGLATMRRIRRA